MLINKKTESNSLVCCITIVEWSSLHLHLQTCFLASSSSHLITWCHLKFIYSVWFLTLNIAVTKFSGFSLQGKDVFLCPRAFLNRITDTFITQTVCFSGQLTSVLLWQALWLFSWYLTSVFLGSAVSCPSTQWLEKKKLETDHFNAPVFIYQTVHDWLFWSRSLETTPF